MKTTRQQLYKALCLKLTTASPQALTTLYHHVHSLKLGEEYIFKTEQDFRGLLQFLNNSN
ncbi:hypothetical protein [Mangrovibacterium marinum]|uniref:Uncharacterized protein n=1 Tax=Mangrovibacterium marinum TaxID=1639118 RepID=A0A2T5C0P0_9BACT|nr:hypothetical protein [Mangrovibacterium marinum]PTN08182.1 hypothetical protein C8N47_11068 [Mangrovibacterium marinum]